MGCVSKSKLLVISKAKMSQNNASGSGAARCAPAHTDDEGCT